MWIEIFDSMCFLAVETAGKRPHSNQICKKMCFESTSNVNKALVNENRIIRQHENNDLRLRYSTWPNKGELDTNKLDDFSSLAGICPVANSYSLLRPWEYVNVSMET